MRQHLTTTSGAPGRRGDTGVFYPSRLAGEKPGDHSGGMLLVHDSDRKARLSAAGDFRDEAAEFTVVSMLFEARVCVGIIRLQANQFIGRFLSLRARACNLFAEVSPSLQRLHGSAQEPFICRAKRRFVKKSTFHVVLSEVSRSMLPAKAAKSQAKRNLPPKWFLRSAVPVRNFALVFRLAL
jgi:hypothetical protein